MFIVATPAYRGQLVDLAYEDATGKQRRFMRNLGAEPIAVVDDPTRTEGIPSVVANALVRRGKASVVEGDTVRSAPSAEASHKHEAATAKKPTKSTETRKEL